MENSTTVAVLQHATKRIGNRTIINDLSFEIPAGEVFGFLVHMGRGKRPRSA